ncbi:MAG TPA: SLBB domain-containing protein, partial [Perlabentimonas sp.]|nr:SLBB domain-containing protein [Perlabentimonas sp.]
MLRFFKLTLGLALLVLLSNPYTTNAQQTDLSSIKVDKLSDGQVKQFLTKAKTTGMTTQELESEAISRGMPYDEVLKLRERIAALDMGEDKTVGQGDVEERKASLESSTKSLAEGQLSEINVFGSSLFKRKDLTFEPSLNIPTPTDYQLGPGDVLNIEVWGASQNSFRLKISSEGQILVPNLGPIQVSGLDVDKASTLIINRLSSIYSGLKGSSPNTFAQVSLGNIRSIKINITGDAYMPGTYTLPAFATVFNALYVAGGPGENGTYREIKVIRSGNIVANIDLYTFLLKGETSQNIRLQDEDLVFIASYKNRVTLAGEVIRPATYELREYETMANLIEYAGGFSSNAYFKQLVVNRKTESERRLLNLESDLFSSFQLKNGDMIKVGEILERYENRVTIRGAVFREGEFAQTEGMTLTNLIDRAEGLREDAFTSRIAIYRQKDNLEIEILEINLDDITKNSNADIVLQREDLVVISSALELQQKRTVRINGQVQNPGTFSYAENLNLGELIRKAGGFNESASLARIDVARRIKNPIALKTEEIITEIYSFTLDKDLSIGDQGSSFILQPFDIVFVRPSPVYKAQTLATAQGELMFPGNYPITRKDEKISDLVARAGGLTDQAYLDGATLLRKIDKAQREQLERIEDMESDDLSFNLNIEGNKETHQAIGINLQQILNNPGGIDDLILREGDILRVPLRMQTVRLNGELLNP